MTPFDRLRRSVIRLTGRDLAPYKHSVLCRRLRIHAGERAGGDEEAYLDLLESGGALARAEAQRLARVNRKPLSYQLSAISYQLSAISYQLSAISYQP